MRRDPRAARLRRVAKPYRASRAENRISDHSESVGIAVTLRQPPTVELSSVTAPVRARALPDNDAPVVRVMLANARMFPPNVVPVPRVAELPTCQNTLPQREPPFVMTTDELLAVVRVLPILKMKTALGLPWALSVSVPVKPADVLKQ